MVQRSNFEGRPEEALVKKRAIDNRYYHNNKERINAKKRADRLAKKTEEVLDLHRVIRAEMSAGPNECINRIESWER